MQTPQLIRQLLENIGENPDRAGLLQTPDRVAKMHAEIFAGYRAEPEKILKKFDAENYCGLILVKDIEYFSTCEHHLAPFFGVAHIGYLPGKYITGLSKLPRLLDAFASRLQNQERLTQQVASTIENSLDAKGVAVQISGRHLCLCARGAKKLQSETITTCFLGEFEKNAQRRQEFLTQI